MHVALVSASLAFFLGFISTANGLLCACSHCNGTNTCSVEAGGRCFTFVDRDATEKVNVARGCIRGDDANGLQACRMKTTRKQATQCCKKDKCNKRKTPKLATVPPTHSKTTRKPGQIVCHCSECDDSDFCVTDVGGKCLSSVTRHSDGSRTVKLGCTGPETFPFHCYSKSTERRSVTCCDNKDYCNSLLHFFDQPSPTILNPEKEKSTTPSPTKPKIITATTKSDSKTTTATPTNLFSCHCPKCANSVCRTASACVAFRHNEDSLNVTYGCLATEQFISCLGKSSHFFCCKGHFCNKNHEFVVKNVLPTSGSGCSETKGVTSDLGDSEYVVILVCVTVPSVLILFTLTGIFCFTWLKYRKQAEEKRKQAEEKMARPQTTSTLTYDSTPA